MAKLEMQNIQDSPSVDLTYKAPLPAGVPVQTTWESTDSKGFAQPDTAIKTGVVPPISYKRTGTSTNIPKPNIVRIEQLSPIARTRYMSGKASKISEGLAASAVLYGYDVPIDVFYGFAHKDNAITLGVTNGWSPTTGTGMFPQLAGLLSKLPLDIGSDLYSVKLNVTGAIASGIKFVDNLIKTSNTSLGMSNKTVGGATIKDFTNVDLSGLTVKCAWYLPEQEKLAKHALKSLYRMAYPKTVDTRKIGDAITKVVLGQAKGIINAGGDLVGSLVEPIPGASGVVKSLFNSLATPTSTNADKSENSVIGNIAKSVYDGMNKMDGYVTSVNPYPVRLSVGHFLDVEPLVIRNVSTHFSKETFINSKGLHLPIFVETTITFTYWMNPSPDQEFVKILNTEVFGRK